MSIAAPSSANVAVPPPVLMRRWTVDEYHRMIEAGVFASDERFELLEGWIVPKVSRNPPHDACVDQAQEELRRRLPAGWRVRLQSAITTHDSEPEPDIAIVRGSARTYSTRHPGPQDTAMVIEVADSSLLQDRRRKARIYAAAGIASYWIINVSARMVEVYSDPTGPSGAPSYRVRREFRADEQIDIEIEGKCAATVPVADMLP